MELNLADAEATARIGAALAASLPEPPRDGLLLTLAGDLGTGKTTLARGLLRALGVTGTIRSPSYTLVEPYETARLPVHHLDLYRLGGSRALEGLGYRDLRAAGGLLLVEWPERAAAGLGTADLALVLAHQEPGRTVRIAAGTAAGRAWLAGLQAELTRTAAGRRASTSS